jgi:GT2 family glycosyltransferase
MLMSEGSLRGEPMVAAYDGMNSERASFSTPLFSVIVPVYNSQLQLEQCLAALAKSHYKNFEVWVVDDGSTVPVKLVPEAYGYGLIRIDGPGGPARARNLGAEKARGRYIVFIDADVCIHSDTLALFADVFAQDPTIDAVVGSYDETPACPNFISQYKNLFHHFVHQKNHGEVQTFWAGCGAMKRETFVALGGFDQQHYRRPACEDIELGIRMKMAGFRIILDTRIKAQHLKCWSLWGLLTTDIFDRGVPWMNLMLRAGAMTNTLNVAPVQRLSVGLVCLTLLALLTSALWPSMLIAAAGLASFVTSLNLDLYGFYLKKRGLWFALRAIPMHWVYFLCCGLSVVGGAFVNLRNQRVGQNLIEATASSSHVTGSER